MDKRLTSLNPLAASDLGTFDNPLSQYMEATIRGFSIELNRAIQPLLALKRKIATIETKISGITDRQVIDQAIEALADGIGDWCDAYSIMRKSKRLEVVFSQAHYQRLPCSGEVHKLWKSLVYQGSASIYKISATYGPEASLSESHPLLHGGGATNKFVFIAKHFNITERVAPNGIVIWAAIANNGKGVIKKDGWFLYYATEGKHKAQCDVIFYALHWKLNATTKKTSLIKKRRKLTCLICPTMSQVPMHISSTSLSRLMTRFLI